MEHVVIIGNGISGVTLARHIRKNSDKKITIISSESDYFFFHIKQNSCPYTCIANVYKILNKTTFQINKYIFVTKL